MWLLDIAAMGYEFVVLPDHFLAHMPHDLSKYRQFFSRFHAFTDLLWAQLLLERWFIQVNYPKTNSSLDLDYIIQYTMDNVKSVACVGASRLLNILKYVKAEITVNNNVGEVEEHYHERGRPITQCWEEATLNRCLQKHHHGIYFLALRLLGISNSDEQAFVAPLYSGNALSHDWVTECTSLDEGYACRVVQAKV